jgi:hypothetical protein
MPHIHFVYVLLQFAIYSRIKPRSTPLSLANGGTGGAFWTFVVVCVGMFSMAISMAEMASM